MFVRPHMAQGGADRVTLMLLQYLDRSKFEIFLGLMRAEGPLMNDVPQDVTIFDFNSRSLWFMVSPLRKCLIRHHFDIVYSTCGGASIPLSLAYAFLTKGKKPVLIVSERNILLPLYKGYIKRYFMLFLKRLLYQQANYVTAVSVGVAKEIEQLLKVAPNRIKVVNNPVLDINLHKLALEKVDHLWFNNNNFTFLAVGRLVEQKDYPTLIRAFFEARKVCKEIKLVILGDGPLQSFLEELIVQLALSDDVALLGYKKNPFVYMSVSSAFVLSSKHEGMPGVLIQALAINGHCISTDCKTGPNELIEHERNGILVPVGDIHKLAESMVRLCVDKELYAKLEQFSKEKIEKFSVEPALDSYLNFIDNN